MNGQNLTKFGVHSIIDKIYVGIVNHCFSQICNRVTALDSCQNLFFTQYLENELTELNKFCIHMVIDNIYVGIVNRCFSQICNRVTALDYVRIWFLLNILRTTLQNETKFCIHIIIDKIYVGIANHCFFLQICNRVTALDSRQNLVFSSPEPKAHR